MGHIVGKQDTISKDGSHLEQGDTEYMGHSQKLLSHFRGRGEHSATPGTFCVSRIMLHPVKNQLSGKIKFQYVLIVPSSKKMPRFRNRPDVFDVLFGHDKFCLLSRHISLFKERGYYSIKKNCFEEAFLKKYIVISSSLEESWFAWK